MIDREYVQQLARYNQWQNDRLYQAASALSQAELDAPRGAFFGSIMGTLNHIAVGDILWLQRFARMPGAPALLDAVRELPQPARLDLPLDDDFAALRQRRQGLDRLIVDWARTLAAHDLAQPLAYLNTHGEAQRKPFAGLIVHFFNHQTHHRGQASTLLAQLGLAVGVTDLLFLLPDAC